MKQVPLWLMVTTIAVGAALFACGGSSKSDNNSTPGAATATSSSGNGETPSSSSGDTSSELKDLAAKLAGKQMTVSYNFTSSAGGSDTTGSFKFFWKSKDAYRVDITDSGSSTGSFIEKDGKLYSCSSDGSGSGTCVALPISTFPLPFLTFMTDPSTLTNLIDTEANGISFDKSSDTIADQSATCYKASGSVQGQEGSAQYCFNGDGLLLRLEGGSSGNTFSLEATNVSSSVGDSDLALPYDVASIPGQ